MKQATASIESSSNADGRVVARTDDCCGTRETARRGSRTRHQSQADSPHGKNRRRTDRTGARAVVPRSRNKQSDSLIGSDRSRGFLHRRLTVMPGSPRSPCTHHRLRDGDDQKDVIRSPRAFRLRARASPQRATCALPAGGGLWAEPANAHATRRNRQTARHFPSHWLARVDKESTARKAR